MFGASRCNLLKILFVAVVVAPTWGRADETDEDHPIASVSTDATAEKTTDELKPIPDPQLMIDSKGFSGVRILSLAISPDGSLLAAAGGKEVRVWDLKNGALRATLRGYQEPQGYRTGNVNTVVFSPDSRFLVVGVSDNSKLGSTRVYAIDDLSKLHALVPGHIGCTQYVAFSPSGKYLATTGCDGHVRIVEWAAQAGMAKDVGIDVTNLESGITFNSTFPGHFCFPLDDDWLLVQPCGKLMVVNVAQRKTVVDKADWPERLRNLIDQEHEFVEQLAKQGNASEFTTSACVQPRGQVWLVRGGTERTTVGQTKYWVGVWNRNDQTTPSVRYELHRFHPVAVTYNESNGLVASADMLGEIHVWQASSQKQLWCFKSINREIYRVAWSEDGEQLLFGDRAYPQSKYQHNRCGPTLAAFRLKDRCLLPAPAIPDEPAVPTKRNPTDDSLAYLAPTLVEKKSVLQLWTGEQPWSIRPFSKVRGFAADAYAFRFAEHAYGGMGRLPFYVGFDDGGLFQIGMSGAQNASPSLRVYREFLGHQNLITSIAESPNGKLLATSSLDGTIRLWKVGKVQPGADVDFLYDGMRVTVVDPNSQAARAGLQPNDEILQFDGGSFYERLRNIVRGEYHTGQSVALEYRRNDQTYKTKIALTSDREIVEPLLTLFLAEQGEWVLWTDSGYYDASSRGEQMVGWHVNNSRAEPAKFYAVGQLRKHLYRPDVLNVLLADPDNSALALQRANEPLMALPSAPKADLDLRRHADFAPLEPPLVRILEPKSGTSTQAETIRVQAEVVSRAASPIVKTTFLVDGRPIPGDCRQESETTTDGMLHSRYAQVLPLGSGANRISFQARTKETESEFAQVSIACERAATKPSKPKLCILAIGISKHQDPQFDLSFADRDAKEFAAAWERQQGQLYSAVETKVLTNADATVRGIKDGMQWASDTANQPGDVLLVLIAGHGLYDPNGVWYLATHELDLKHLAATTISYAEIGLWLDQQIRGNVILFVDTCHAGSVRGNQAFGLSSASGIQPTGPRGVDLWRGSGSLVLASSLPSEGSVEREDLRHGVFTHALLRALKDKTCDVDHDGKLTFTEIELFVKRKVSALSEGRQNPSSHKPLTVSEVVLAQASQ